MLISAAPVLYVMTRDADRALDFWRDTLGCVVIDQGPHVALLALAGLRIGLTPTTDHAPSPHPILGLPVADIAAASADLAGKGVAFIAYPGLTEGPWQIWTAPGGAKRLNWFADPDGNLLGLVQEA